MYNEQLEALIDAALADGELTEKEKQVLFKKAESFGIDLDEFEMVLDARLVKLQAEQKAKTAAAAPKSDKFGDIRKCPACGAMLQSFQMACPDCGYEFKNIESVQSAQKLFDQLQAVELRKSEKLSNHEVEKQRRLDELSRRHNSDGALVKIFGGSRRHEIQDEEREDLVRELNRHVDVIERESMAEKRNIIKNFPVPNSKEDLMELLAMATSNAYDNDGVIGPEEEVWLQKTDQIYQKIIVCAGKDKQFLAQATNLVVSLMKRLPKSYKKFTQIPPEMRAMVKENLDKESQIKREALVQTIKKWGIYMLVSLVVAIVGLFVTFWLFLIGAIALCVFVALFKKDFTETRDLL